MRRGIAGFLALVAVGACLYLAKRRHSVRTVASATQTKARAIAPDFSLPDLSGQQFTLSSFRGKVVLLDFWATWCDPCREEIPQFIELQNRYGAEGLRIIGVSMDDGPEPVRAFSQQFKMNYLVVMGDAKTGELYGGVLGLPIAFVIGRDGRIVARHIGATNMSVFVNEIVNLLENGNGNGGRPGGDLR